MDTSSFKTESLLEESSSFSPRQTLFSVVAHKITVTFNHMANIDAHVQSSALPATQLPVGNMVYIHFYFRSVGQMKEIMGNHRTTDLG